MKMKNMFNIKASSSDRSSASSASSDYSLHTFSHTMAEEDVDTAEQIISRWDLDNSAVANASNLYQKIPSLFTQENRKESRNFLRAVAALQTAMRFFMSDSASSPGLVRAHNIMRTAMKRLEKEFFTILTIHKSTVLSPESVSGRSSTRSRFSDVEIESESEVSDEGDCFEFSSDENSSPEFVMESLKSIADCMTRAGYGKECVAIYKMVRASIIDESLYSLGVDKSGLSAAQMQKMGWEYLEGKIKKWVGSVRVAVKTIFHGERALCDVVFSNAGEMTRDSLFAEISKDNALALLSFAENAAKCKKLFSPEKMFRFLDMYDAISDIMADLETTFTGELLAGVRSLAVAALLKLGEAVREMLKQFEAAIGKDASKTPVPGGGVHPLTRYVMNYLVFLSDYSGSVAEIIADWPLTTATPLPASYLLSPISVNGEVDQQSPENALQVRLAWIVLTLLCKLDGKAGVYNNHVAQSYLFLANNLNYVVSKVKTSNLVLLMGPDWISTHEAKAKQYFSNYERVGWTRVMTSLPSDPTAEIPLPKVMECFQLFDSAFEETYREQVSWVIPDPRVREQTKVSVTTKLVPVYRAFYEKHRKSFTGVGSQIRYSPEDLENHLSDMFAAASGGGGNTTTAYGHSSTSVSPPPSRGR